ncbi:Ureidoglycolate hydrolase [Devosia limi DSM 17137]|uniref:Ureidoglycolate lyase n=1 Tax=Devosia limi DSM 17137 TaxID=1121477 RepID=A0A0F5LW67_9HYPH|nr:ureidoglycolate lyase [Devosia limi]KKB85912.1 Ureidoglycolate hydrolase [Devosia limi DSM 17137]SHF68650.1 ureidoglycolate lyase [Devosia limi DSM 17137]
MADIDIEPLTAETFAPFGQVIWIDDAHHYPINNGMTERYHDLARVELGGVHPRPLISIFRGQPYALPLALTLVERHPLGSQAFYPLSPHPFLVIVALDHAGIPGTPRAFITAPGQGVNIAMNTWHGVLTPLEAEADFLVVDRGGDGNNLEEHHFKTPYLVRLPA